jgi:glycosyltransferase involved in cell wall biosynthesis
MGGIFHKSGLISETALADLSLVIITLNEAENLPALLESVPKNVEIIVVDSGSTDQTCQIANKFGARVEHRAFDNFASQKNYAMSLASRRWTLCLDADEFPDENLWHAVTGAVSGKSQETSAFSMKRRLIFLGRKMRYGRTQDHVIRLFHSHSASYQNEIHETIVLPKSTSVLSLEGVLWHKSYKDLDDYFSKFNRYTSIMAISRWKSGKSRPSVFLMAARLPTDFIIRYLLKLGFLDGWQGFLWAAISSFYSLIKYAKLKEISEKVSG